MALRCRVIFLLRYFTHIHIRESRVLSDGDRSAVTESEKGILDLNCEYENHKLESYLAQIVANEQTTKLNMQIQSSRNWSMNPFESSRNKIMFSPSPLVRSTYKKPF